MLRTGIVNAKILHTCRSIYDEAMPVLYNKNTFMFTSPQHIEDFAYDSFERDDEIFHLSPRFCLPNSPHGRLSLVHSVILRLGSHCYHLRDIPAQNTYLWSIWRCFFVSKFADELVGFPALRNLSLDFSEWRLTAAETDSLSVSVPPSIKTPDALKRRLYMIQSHFWSPQYTLILTIASYAPSSRS